MSTTFSVVKIPAQARSFKQILHCFSGDKSTGDFHWDILYPIHSGCYMGLSKKVDQSDHNKASLCLLRVCGIVEATISCLIGPYRI